MDIIAVGLNHKAAPVDIREQLAFGPTTLPQALEQFTPRNGAHPGYAREGTVLSTCNRMEVYALAEDAAEGHDSVCRFLSNFHQLSPDTFRDYLYFYANDQAIAHLFAVACGLDSMIVGEPQILGQVADAHEEALCHNAAGAVLSALFRRAITVGKRARTETAISQNAVSISYAAVELARKIFGDLARRQVLLIGAGEMAELAAKNLVDNGVQTITVCNRTESRAEALAGQFGGRALGWERIAEALWGADIVITSTASPRPIIHPPMVRDAMHMRRNRPLFFIDIAVPRDVEPEVQHIGNVYLYDVDDMEAVVAANVEERRREIPKVQAIIDREVSNYVSWFRSLDVAPTIAELRGQAESIRQAELEKALRRLEHLSDRERNVIAALTKGIVNKILHQPTVRLKQQASNGNAYEYAQTVRELFGLGEGGEECEP